MMLVSPSEGYELWAETFDADPNPLVALETRALAPWLANVRGKRVVDVCCGTGRWLRPLAARGARVAGCDLSARMLARGPACAAQANARRLPFATASADIVLCTLSLGYLTPVRQALREMRRVVQTGGAVIVTDMHPDAIRRGWRRSFRHGGSVYEIETAAQALDDLRVEGLRLEDECAFSFGEAERAIFEAAGKSGVFFEGACDGPALWMLRWRAA